MSYAFSLSFNKWDHYPIGLPVSLRMLLQAYTSIPLATSIDIYCISALRPGKSLHGGSTHLALIDSKAVISLSSSP